MIDMKTDFSHISRSKGGGTDILKSFKVLTLFLLLHLGPLVNEDFTFLSDRIPAQTGFVVQSLGHVWLFATPWISSPVKPGNGVKYPRAVF